MLGQSIDSIENWDLEIKLDGPVRSPQISLSSSLGPQLAEALNGFAGQLARDQAKRLQDRIDTEVQSTLAKADDVMREVDEVRQTLQTINSEVSSIQQNVARYIGNGVLR
jgi:chromosome segregation ATPase